MRRVFSAAVLLLVMLGWGPTPASAVQTNASAAVLMDADSGRILYSENMHERRQIASITKLMTALVAVENVEDLSTEIVIQPHWVGAEGSSIYLKPYEKLSLNTLLYGLLLQSGNDAAESIACYIAGDIPAFSDLMNARAAELGMQNTRFSNPSGLNDESHYSTAYDMALLAVACLDNDVVAQICATKQATFDGRTFYNHNKLLGRYEGCIGMKTGYTELAGRTLVSAAIRNGQTLICVTLNDRNDWNDHEALFDYGFAAYPLQQLHHDNECFGYVKVEGSLLPRIPVVADSTACYPLSNGETPERVVKIADRVCAPVAQGAAVGSVIWYMNGTAIAESALVCRYGAESDIEVQRKMKDRAFDWFFGNQS